MVMNIPVRAIQPVMHLRVKELKVGRLVLHLSGMAAITAVVMPLNHGDI
jgi:hypothetical protein